MKTVKERTDAIVRVAEDRAKSWGDVKDEAEKQLTELATELAAERDLAQRSDLETQKQLQEFQDKLAELHGTCEMQQSQIVGQAANIQQTMERFNKVREYYRNSMATIKELLDIFDRADVIEALTGPQWKRVVFIRRVWEDTYADNPFCVFDQSPRPRAQGPLSDGTIEKILGHVLKDLEIRARTEFPLIVTFTGAWNVDRDSFSTSPHVPRVTELKVRRV